MADIDGITTDGSKWSLRLGISNNGEVVSVGKRELTVKTVSSLNERINSSRPLIDINMTIFEDKVFVRNDIVQVQGIMSHMFKSRGEGRTTYIRYLKIKTLHIMVIHSRFIVPEWISYESSVNTCKWNFTSSGEPDDCNIEFDTSPNATTSFFMKLENDNFTMFRFSDILSFNMTFIVDPNDELPKGKGDMSSMIVAHPSCLPSVYSSWGTNEEMCGPFKGIIAVI